MNSIISKLNAELEKYNKGCGKVLKTIKMGEAWEDTNIKCGEIIGKEKHICLSCQAGKNATEKAIEIVTAGIKETKDKIDLKISWAECHATTQSPSEYFDNLREDVADVLKETLGKVEG